MKVAVQDIQKEGSLGGTTLGMRLDENSLDFLMHTLSNIYSDPQLAVIRELSVNARDSHIAAGQTRPIEVSTPTWMAPFFVVEDFGLGLGLDDITNIYSAYGASTKRDTNAQTGSLGLGSKSPLTLTDQFTVISVKDGVQISIVVSRTPTGGGVMQIVDTSKTNKPNGVRIQVPVPQDSSFTNKVYDFFKFWDPGLALIDGKEPNYETELIKVDDNLFLKESKSSFGHYDDYVIMGGIAYKTDKLLTSYHGRKFGVRAHVPIGSVAFTPSREELHYTKATLDVIEDINSRLSANLLSQITAEIEACSDRITAYKKYEEWSNIIGSSIRIPRKYKGEDIPTHIKGMGASYSATRRYGQTGRSVEFEELSISVNSLLPGKRYYNTADYVFVYNLPDEKYTSYQKSKVKAYAESVGVSPHNVLFTNDKELYESVWLPDTIQKWDWESIKKTLTAPKSKRVKHDKYPCFNGTDWANEDIDPAQTTVYYVTGQHTQQYNVSAFYKLYKGKAQFFKFPQNRADKFLRLFPAAIELNTFVDQEKDKIKDSLTESDLVIYYGNYPHWLRNLSTEKIDDPELKKLIESAGAKQDVTRLDKWNSFNRGLEGIQRPKMKVGPKPASRLSRYPLFKDLNPWSFDQYDELTIYINAKYKELT